jgi:osmotically-inducible protein OsmY
MLRRPEPVIDRTEDPRILREVEERLRTEPSVDAARVRVEVDGAIVILYGSVDGLAAWNCAIRTAQLVQGVRSVVDYLVIERGPREVPCLAPRGFTSG